MRARTWRSSLSGRVWVEARLKLRAEVGLSWRETNFLLLWGGYRKSR
jgi:hypothetical protein